MKWSVGLETSVHFIQKASSSGGYGKLTIANYILYFAIIVGRGLPSQLKLVNGLNSERFVFLFFCHFLLSLSLSVV